jgi:tetratricopeptide (TPR) repeat protein
VDTPLGPCVVVERRYAADHRHGLLPLGPCAGRLDPGSAGFALLAGAGHAGDEPGPLGDGPRPLLFVDLETTGLAGGAGTHAFLVGCAWFEGDAFRVQQFFMVGHALERALLGAVRERLEAGGPLVTYNGRTFDVPLLETRYVYHRQAPPFGARPHLDMLPIARRLWRAARPVVDVPGGQTESCALSALERVLFGVRRTGDVPGSEIPGRYFTFLRTGDAVPLDPVLEHNRLDLVSLAVLTARALTLLADAPDGAERPRELLGLARIFERVGLLDRADQCYARAVALASSSWHEDDEIVAAEACRGLALRCRRASRHAEAATHWEALTRLRRCPAPLRREALEALAIHHEHRSRDLDRARLFAEQSGRLARSAWEQDDAGRRLARLRRKQAQGSARRGDESLWN